LAKGSKNGADQPIRAANEYQRMAKEKQEDNWSSPHIGEEASCLKGD